VVDIRNPEPRLALAAYRALMLAGSIQLLAPSFRKIQDRGYRPPLLCPPIGAARWRATRTARTHLSCRASDVGLSSSLYGDGECRTSSLKWWVLDGILLRAFEQYQGHVVSGEISTAVSQNFYPQFEDSNQPPRNSSVAGEIPPDPTDEAPSWGLYKNGGMYAGSCADIFLPTPGSSSTYWRAGKICA
jgi:hypothetical protein